MPLAPSSRALAASLTHQPRRERDARARRWVAQRPIAQVIANQPALQRSRAMPAGVDSRRWPARTVDQDPVTSPVAETSVEHIYERSDDLDGEVVCRHIGVRGTPRSIAVPVASWHRQHQMAATVLAWFGSDVDVAELALRVARSFSRLRGAFFSGAVWAIRITLSCVLHKAGPSIGSTSSS